MRSASRSSSCSPTKPAWSPVRRSASTPASPSPASSHNQQKRGRSGLLRPQDRPDQRDHDGVLRAGRGHAGPAPARLPRASLLLATTRSTRSPTAGFRVIVPSQRGYAGTDAPPTPRPTASRTWSPTSPGCSTRWGSSRRSGSATTGARCPPGTRACLRPRPGARPGQPLHALLHLGIAQGHDRNLRRTARAQPLHARPSRSPGVGEAILEKDVEHTFRSMLRGRGYTMDEFEAAPERDPGSARRGVRRRSAAVRRADRQRARSSPSTSTSTAAPASPAASTGTARCARTSKRPRAPTT